MANRRPRRQRAKSSAPTLPKDPRQVGITHLGAKGDGVGRDEQGTLYFVPRSAPGDELRVKVTGKRQDAFVAEIEEVLTAGPDRQDAPCPYYGHCGGCQLQHISDQAYGAFKKQLLETMLARHHLDGPVQDPVLTGPGLRRRAAFSVMKKGKTIVFGFNARHSHRIAEIGSCLLLTPRLSDLIPDLRALLQVIMKQEGRGDVIINDPEGVADLVFALPGFPDLKVQEKLMDFAEKHRIGRLSWQRDAKGDVEILAEREAVRTHFSDIPVTLPPAPFLQPSKAGEEALARLACAALTGEKKILDLFSGCGSFTMALARHATVHAVESNPQALKAMERAAGQAGIGGKITTEVRDLDRQPLMDKELEKYQAVLFDPPRAGAMEQARALAESDVPLVIAVSCNPSTFARDCALLTEGGFRLEKVIPVDQFTWSAHVEAIGILRK